MTDLIGFQLESPGGIDRGSAPLELARALVRVGADLASAAQPTESRVARTISNTEAWLSNYSSTPNEADDHLRQLILAAYALDGSIRQLQVQRYVRTDSYRRVWHSDLATAQPRRQLGGGWTVPVTHIGNRIFSLAIQGPGMLIADGTIIEDRPIVSLPDISLPESPEVDTSPRAFVAAGKELEKFFDTTEATIVGQTVTEDHERKPFLVRWRRDSTLLRGTVDVTQVPEGHIVETPNTAVHIPPEQLEEGRTVLIMSTALRAANLPTAKQHGVLWHLMHHGRRAS